MVETTATTTLPAIERTRVWTQQRIRWGDVDGPRWALKYAMVELPADTARNAIAAGAAMVTDDSRIPNLCATYGVAAYGPLISPLPDAHDLDTAPVEPIAEAAA